MPRARSSSAFSLVEIIVAVGVLGLGLTLVIGLFAPVSRSVTTNLDAEAAARAAEAAITYLKALQWNQARNYIKSDSAYNNQLTSEGRGNYNPVGDGQTLYVNRRGTIIGTYNDAVWNGDHGAQYYEVIAIRNERVSPTGNDGTATMIAFTVRVRWPCFLPGSGGVGSTQFGRNPAPGRGQLAYDHSQKEVLFVNGSITR